MILSFWRAIGLNLNNVAASKLSNLIFSFVLAVPPTVENLSVETLTSTSVNITWRKPKIPEGSEELVTYNVECYHCINESKCHALVENLKFFPAKTKLRTTYVVVSGLKLDEKYKFKVTSINNWLKNVSSDKWMFKYTGLYLNKYSKAPFNFPSDTCKSMIFLQSLWKSLSW